MNLSTVPPIFNDFDPCNEPDYLPTTREFYNALGKLVLYIFKVSLSRVKKIHFRSEI